MFFFTNFDFSKKFFQSLYEYHRWKELKKLTIFKKKCVPKSQFQADLLAISLISEKHFSEMFFFYESGSRKWPINRLGNEVSGRIFFLKWSEFWALSNGGTFRAIGNFFFWKSKFVKKNIFVKKKHFHKMFFLWLNATLKKF